MRQRHERTGVGDHHEGTRCQRVILHVSLSKYQAYPCLLCPSPTCHYHLFLDPHPSFPSTHNFSEKTWPCSRQCKSNRGEIDGSNDSQPYWGEIHASDIYWFGDWWIRIYGLKLSKLFMASAISCQYFPSSQLRLDDIGSSWLMSVMMKTLVCSLVVIWKIQVK